MSVSQHSIIFAPCEALAGTSAFPYDVRIFSRDDDLHEIFELRREAFAAEGWLNPNGGVSDATDDAPQAIQFAAFHGSGDIKCAARITFKGWTEPITVLPCAPYFPALQSAGLRKLSIAELSHLVLDPRVTDPAHRLVFYSAMVRAGLLAVQSARVAMLVAAAQPERVEFYTHLLRFHVIGTPASYPPAAAPSTLVGGNMVGAGLRSVERIDFFKTSPNEVTSMRQALVRCLGESSHTHVLSTSVYGPGA